LSGPRRCPAKGGLFVSVLYILLPLAIVIAAIAVLVFVWAARSGQFDDLETPSRRVLFDDDEPPEPGSQHRK
jgi:cbb3-type cytochrome oxidase maturation protein